MLNSWKKKQELEEARLQAEKELQEIGIQKEDLKQQRANVVIELQRHPKHAKRMQKIVEDAALLEAM